MTGESLSHELSADCHAALAALDPMRLDAMDKILALAFFGQSA